MERKCLKSLQSAVCILHPACILLLVCGLHFTPGPQPEVWVCFLHWPVEKVLTDKHDSDSFRARTQLFSRMFSTFVAKLGSN